MNREEKRAYDAVHGPAYYASHRKEYVAYSAAYREANRDAILGKKAKKHSEFIEWLQILRTNNGCEDCGTHEGRLHHHHVDPKTKMYNVTRMYWCSLDTLEEELEKCVVLCVPCHNVRHARHFKDDTEEGGSQ